LIKRSGGSADAPGSIWHGGVVRFRRDEGFTLIEMAVVVAVVGILMTMGMASYRAMNRIADDKAVQLDLLTAAKVQTLHYLENGTFADDPVVLFDLEPTLRYSLEGDPAGTVVVRTEPGRSALDVCVFARTPQGDWFAVRHSAVEGDRYAVASPTQCMPGNTDTWSKDPW
jgi:prepilin-type N-terminal cleavage/methylation domain-containing protein